MTDAEFWAELDRQQAEQIRIDKMATDIEAWNKAVSEANHARAVKRHLATKKKPEDPKP